MNTSNIAQLLKRNPFYQVRISLAEDGGFDAKVVDTKGGQSTAIIHVQQPTVISCMNELDLAIEDFH